jgi:two-component system CheB/CheR fusion protein
MYFNAEMQAKILPRFGFAIRNNGFIFLGKAEMLLAHSDVFNTVNLKHRIFQKIASPARFGALSPMLSAASAGTPPRLSGSTPLLQEMAFDHSPVARLVINRAGQLMLANQKARNLFDLSRAAVGQPLRDLEVSYRPVELRSRIEEAIAQRQSVVLRGSRWNSPHAGTMFLDVQVQPLFDSGSTICGVSINFMDVTRDQQLQQELEHSKQELEVAYEELQSTNEELETTNEELQSSNEELETTNEELQSTNEELETMNEELQSTNEELQTVNDELHNSAEERNRSNAFLEAILASLDRGVVVVDHELVILAWNRQAEELWGIRSDEAVGRHLLNLDIGLPLDELRQPLRDCMAGSLDHATDFTLSAINRRGRRIECYITCTALSGPGADGSEPEVQGLILLMKDHLVSDNAE